jgi:hypothetical protein
VIFYVRTECYAVLKYLRNRDVLKLDWTCHGGFVIVWTLQLDLVECLRSDFQCPSILFLNFRLLCIAAQN